MEIRWVDTYVDDLTAYIDDSEARWGTGTMAARIYRLSGVWQGLYWPQCNIVKQGHVPKCATREEAKALATALLRLES